jgi:hypothetical protein
MRKALAILHGQREIPLSDGMVVGRNPDCHIVLGNDPKVSRLHARFLLQDGVALVEDLQSANGVHLNGRRIRERATVRPGDQLRIGEQQLLLVEHDIPTRRHAATIPDMASYRGSFSFDDPEPMTEGSIALAGPKNWEPLRAALAEEDLDRAAVLLRIAFDRVMDQALSQGRLEPDTQEAICTYAFALASKTHQGVWLNLLFHVHMLVAQPLPHASAATLPQLVHHVRGLEPLTLESYVRVLRASRSRLTPVERQLCTTLESALLIASSHA